MKIGIDLDDTICNSSPVFVAQAFKFCLERGLKPNAKIAWRDYHVKTILGLDEKQTGEFMTLYHDTLIDLVQPHYLVKETLAALKTDGHQIIFITARPNEPRGSVAITYAWFKRYQLPYDQIRFACQDKGQSCLKDKIDVFIDDLPNHCRAAARRGVKTFVYDCPWNQSLRRRDVKRIYIWPQFYQAVRALAKQQND
jgi:uncharacterized HAD superfamily protein